MTQRHAERQSTAAFLRRLSPAASTSLGRLLGVAIDGAATAARAVEHALADAATAARVLAAVPTPSAQLLMRWILRGENAMRPSWGGSRQDRTEPLELEDVRKAAQPLEQHGLVVDLGGPIAVLPALAKALRPDAIEYALSSVREDPDKTPPYPFVLALASALYAVEAPMITQSGELHARSKQKLEKRAGGDAIAGFGIDFAETVLRTVAVLEEQSRGNSTCLRVDPHRAAAVLCAPPEALALATVQIAPASEMLLRTLYQVRSAASSRTDALATAGSKGGTRRADPREGATLDEIEAQITAPRHRGWNVGPDPLDAWELAFSLEMLRSSGLIDVVPGGPPTRVRPATPRPHRNAAWVVQPSFDVLVPWDAAPWRVATLGCFADLERIDRVCRFHLTPESVARGIGILDPSSIASTLAEGCDGPLPQNVLATVEGWVGRGSPLRSIRGDAMVASDEAHEQLLRGFVGDGVVEVAPHVFYVPRDVVADVEAEARKRGVVLAPRVGGDEDARAWRSQEKSDVDTEARGARKMLDWLTAADALARVDAETAARGGRAEKSKRAAVAPPPQDRDVAAMDEAASLVGDDDGATDAAADFDEPDDSSRGPGPARSADAQRPTATTRVAPHPIPSISAPIDAWESPLPGVLRAVLLDAIRGQKAMTLLYTSRNQESVEHRVVPCGLRTVAGREELLARDEVTEADCVLPLDRITAIQRPAT